MPGPSDCGHCVSLPSYRVHLLKGGQLSGVIEVGPTQSLEGGAADHKTAFIMTLSNGAAVLDGRDRAREFRAGKPSMAAQKAFYSWRREQEEPWGAQGARLRVSADVRAWLGGLEGVTREQTDAFLKRMEQLTVAETHTGVEVFIAKSGQAKPRRYVCYQRLNDRPNAHQVRKMIVMESYAHPCAEGMPEDAALTKLLTPFSE